jgi:hypothetical protein
MKKVKLYKKSFRYRNSGEERNHTVLVTNQNKTALRGFDVTDATEQEVKTINTAWNRVSYRDMSLTKKEASVVKNMGDSCFKKFNTEKIRYFHKN